VTGVAAVLERDQGSRAVTADAQAGGDRAGEDALGSVQVAGDRAVRRGDREDRRRRGDDLPLLGMLIHRTAPAEVATTLRITRGELDQRIAGVPEADPRPGELTAAFVD
jgi:hypothetical protein